jgi:hypothetical protein
VAEVATYSTLVAHFSLAQGAVARCAVAVQQPTSEAQNASGWSNCVSCICTAALLVSRLRRVAMAPFCRVIVDWYGHECVRRGVTRVGRVSGGARSDLRRSPHIFHEPKRLSFEVRGWSFNFHRANVTFSMQTSRYSQCGPGRAGVYMLTPGKMWCLPKCANSVPTLDQEHCYSLPHDSAHVPLTPSVLLLCIHNQDHTQAFVSPLRP